MPLTRLQADLLLLVTAIIWGVAFVAQKDAMSHVGPLTFVAARFWLSFVLVLPFAVKEHRRAQKMAVSPALRLDLMLICAAFAGGSVLQQAGIGGTSVANAGFLTGLYVIFVPLIGWIFYKQKISPWILPAALTSAAGTWFLSGGSFSGFGRGDFLVLLCAIVFALQITLVGRIMRAAPAGPLRLCVLQYAATFLTVGGAAFIFETPSMEGLHAALWPILYAGLISGGIAFTVQVIAQKYTPSSDAGIILSAEAVFAAIAGALLLNERLSAMGIAGCTLIALAIITVELGPRIPAYKARR